MERADKLNLKTFAPSLVNYFLPFGIIALVAMLVLPLPVALLDTFFVLNITLSLLILMVALHTQRPLDFSSFPNLLLIATVLRLGLNVASTRIVLKDGHTGPDAAGQVIEAFGEFIVSGNYANQAAVIDAGNVWGVDYSDSLDDSNEIRSTLGFNLSWISPAGPMTFVISNNVSKASTDQDESFNFRLGTTF